MEGHCGRTEQVLWPISVFSGIIMCKFISLGYFLSDLATILWLFPSLGGKEYVFGPFWTEEFKYVHLQWCGFIHWMAGRTTPLYIPFNRIKELAKFKQQKCEVTAMELVTKVARILLFIYFFTHMYLHFDQVKTIFPLRFYSLPTVPPMTTVMNVLWFWKLFKGMMVKTLSKRRQTHQ